MDKHCLLYSLNLTTLFELHLVLVLNSLFDYLDYLFDYSEKKKQTKHFHIYFCIHSVHIWHVNIYLQHQHMISKKKWLL